MTEAALHTMDSSARPGGLMTWRDAVTPLSRSSRRRWTLAYALLLVLGGVVVGGVGGVSGGTADNAQLPLLVALLIVFGMLRRGTRRLTALDHPELDERDRAERDRAFRLAYPLLLAVMALSPVALSGLLPDIERSEILSDRLALLPLIAVLTLLGRPRPARRGTATGSGHHAVGPRGGSRHGGGRGRRAADRDLATPARLRLCGARR